MEKTFPKARLNLKRGKRLFQKHDEIFKYYQNFCATLQIRNPYNFWFIFMEKDDLINSF